MSRSTTASRLQTLVVRVALGCLLVSAVSLLCAYLWQPGPAWTYEYSAWRFREHPSWLDVRVPGVPAIVFLEWSHSLVIAVLCCWVIGWSHRRDALHAWHVLTRARCEGQQVVGLRLVVGVGAVAMLCYLATFTAFIGPQTLRQLYEVDHGQPVVPSSEFLRVYTAPYVRYLPYAFINFFVGILSIASVCLVTMTRDLRLTMRDWRECFDAHGAHATPADILSAFSRFRRRSVRRCGKYSTLTILLGLFALFEQTLGIYSATTSAADVARMGIGFVGVYLLSVVIVIVLYHRAFTRANERLDRLGYDAHEWESRNNVSAFWNQLAGRNIGLVVGCGLLANNAYPWFTDTLLWIAGQFRVGR